ncbi:DUF2770 family protein [Siccibacter colletis]
MRRIIQFLINNVRQHLMLYIVLWVVLAILDIFLIATL